jgi:hypothetical protein
MSAIEKFYEVGAGRGERPADRRVRSGDLDEDDHQRVKRQGFDQGQTQN